MTRAASHDHLSDLRPVLKRALIALHQLARLDLLRDLFGTVAISPAVALETAPSVRPRPERIPERPLALPLDPRVLRASLDPGETEAIGLALELGASWVILDDLPARRLADELGLRVVGTRGVLLQAKRRGLLASIRPSLDALVAVKFFVGPDLLVQLLAEAGEEGG